MRSNDRVLLARGTARVGLCAAAVAALSACGEAGGATPGPFVTAADSAVVGAGNPDSSLPPGTAGGAGAGAGTGGGAASGGAGTGGGTLGGAPMGGGSAGAGPIDAGGGAAAGGGMPQDAAPAND